MCSHPSAASQFHQHGRLWTPLFIYSLISSFYFIPNCSPLACYCCCLLHPLAGCPRRLFICHCLPHFFSTPLSSLLRSLRQSLECQGFFSSFTFSVSLFAKIPRVPLFIGFSACPCLRSHTVPFLPKASGVVQAANRIHVKITIKGKKNNQ